MSDIFGEDVLTIVSWLLRRFADDSIWPQELRALRKHEHFLFGVRDVGIPKNT